MQVEASNVSSLLEIGVGINLALALIDGFRARLGYYATYFAENLLSKKSIEIGLDTLRLLEDPTETDKAVAVKAEQFCGLIDELPDKVLLGESVQDVIKLFSVFWALFILVNVIRFSFGGYKVDEWEIWALTATCVFPFLLFVFLSLRALYQAFRLRRQVDFFLLTNKSLIESQKERTSKDILLS